MQKLREMIQSHLEITGHSIKSFADEIGVGHNTIGRIVKSEEPALPRLETLQALARGMNVNIFTVIAAALGVELPESFHRSLAAEQVEKLPAEQQQVILALIAAFSRQPDSTERGGE